eukprot:scaffold257_cov241-Pinguiococcus_pyrenoidosus.AAC.5
MGLRGVVNAFADGPMGVVLDQRTHTGMRPAVQEAFQRPVSKQERQLGDLDCDPLAGAPGLAPYSRYSKGRLQPLAFGFWRSTISRYVCQQRVERAGG